MTVNELLDYIERNQIPGDTDIIPFIMKDFFNPVPIEGCCLSFSKSFLSEKYIELLSPYTQLAPDCIDSRPCFAIQYRRGGFRVCGILTEKAYDHDGECPFCKPVRELTGDEEYPYDTNYGRHRA